jgi:ABC-type multidrug transport system ATPase subunit
LRISAAFRHVRRQVRRLIGYCPQFDALIGTLTAREHLTLFARIKGMPESRLHEYVLWRCDGMGWWI